MNKPRTEIFFLHLSSGMTLRSKNHITILTDKDLLAQYAASGNAEYFGVLYNRYIPLLYGVCLKYLNDESKAQEAVARLFEELLLKLPGCEIPAFRTLLYNEACDYCFRVIEKENKEIPVRFNNNKPESAEILRLLCDEETGDKRTQALHNCLGRLPDGQRICITHFFIKEMSYADIVEKTGYALNTVKSNIENGKRNLMICINKHSK